MKALFLTNEYPPHVYGGAGVHVDYLTRELAKSMPIEVRCFGNQKLEESNLTVRGFDIDFSQFTCPKQLQSVFGAVRRCADFNLINIDADLVHCHTWYSHFGGILAKINYGIPLIITVHSLEPLRPWKREQLGGGYDFSLWIEKTALEMADVIIAVSHQTKKDVERLFKINPARVRVIHNGIDLEEFRKVESTEKILPFGIDLTQPYLLFVGRITRQKGILHLVRAIEFMNRDFQIVLCAAAPDTKEIEAETRQAIEEMKARRPGLTWVNTMLDKETLRELYSHAAVFCCPSIYEPFGIINLEAMACETAVVATAVGGIKEVVVEGETGLLVPIDQLDKSPFEPRSPQKFARDLAGRINQLMADPALRQKLGRVGRKRVEERFGWPAIAAQTKTLYSQLKGSRPTT